MKKYYGKQKVFYDKVMRFVDEWSEYKDIIMEADNNKTYDRQTFDIVNVYNRAFYDLLKDLGVYRIRRYEKGMVYAKFRARKKIRPLVIEVWHIFTAYLLRRLMHINIYSANLYTKDGFLYMTVMKNVIFASSVNILFDERKAEELVFIAYDMYKANLILDSIMRMSYDTLEKVKNKYIKEDNLFNDFIKPSVERVFEIVNDTVWAKDVEKSIRDKFLENIDIALRRYLNIWSK